MPRSRVIAAAPSLIPVLGVVMRVVQCYALSSHVYEYDVIVNTNMVL